MGDRVRQIERGSANRHNAEVTEILPKHHRRSAVIYVRKTSTIYITNRIKKPSKYSILSTRRSVIIGNYSIFYFTLQSLSIL